MPANIPPPYTESGLADTFLTLHRKTFRYCPAWNQWLAWTGVRWTTDSADPLQRALTATLRELRQLCHEGRLFQFIPLLDRAEKRSVRANILALARHEATAVDPEQLDADPLLLNCLNGTLDLRTGTLREHRREDLITRVASAHWQPDATCPVWESFLDRVCAGDPELIDYLQRSIGYTLTGDVREQIVFLLWGDGANGKSTLLLALLDLLGGYGQPADANLLSRQGLSEARLFRSRLVVLPEMPDGQRLSESRLKALTGGDRMVEGAHTFAPSHKLWMASNQLPQIRGTEHAIWRRLRPIHFSVKIEESARDTGLPEKLRGELPGILRWAVDGCLAWRRDRLSPPPKLRAAAEEYRIEQDHVTTFVAERCLTGSDKSATAKELYDAYRSWAEQSGETPLVPKAFGTRLARQGFESIRSGKEGTRAWAALSLADAKNQADATEVPAFRACALPSVARSPRMAWRAYSAASTLRVSSMSALI